MGSSHLSAGCGSVPPEETPAGDCGEYASSGVTSNTEGNQLPAALAWNGYRPAPVFSEQPRVEEEISAGDFLDCTGSRGIDAVVFVSFCLT